MQRDVLRAVKLRELHQLGQARLRFLHLPCIHARTQIRPDRSDFSGCAFAFQAEVVVDGQRRVVAEHRAGVDGLAPGEGGNAGRGKVVVDPTIALRSDHWIAVIGVAKPELSCGASFYDT